MRSPLIQNFGSAANLNIHLHCLVLDGVYCSTEGVPVFREVRAASIDELQALLGRIIKRHDAIDPHRVPH